MCLPIWNQLYKRKRWEKDATTLDAIKKTHITHTWIWINKSLVNPKSTSNQASKPCTVLQYPSRRNVTTLDAVKKHVLFYCIQRLLFHMWHSHTQEVMREGVSRTVNVRHELRHELHVTFDCIPETIFSSVTWLHVVSGSSHMWQFVPHTYSSWHTLSHHLMPVVMPHMTTLSRVTWL